MKLFSAWPRWVQILFSVALFTSVVAGWIAFDYHSHAPSTAGKTELAREFESGPHMWLDRPLDASVFADKLRQGEIAAVGVDGQRVLATTRSGEQFSTELVAGEEGLLAGLETASREQGFALTRISVDARTVGERIVASTGSVLERLFTLLTVAAMVVLGVYLLRQGAMGGGAKARLAEKPQTSFVDVVGASDAKTSLQQVTAFMRDPQKYLALGAKPPRGVLLEGPPGTGKTLLARALAGECKANFIAVDGSHFSSMFYGQGIAKVRELFATARKNAPCIIFIDEFDGIGKRASGAKVEGGQSEENRIINKLLVEMDGFSTSDNIIVIGATNHVGNVDEALRRPGRFDLVARVNLPTVHDRRELFELCLARVRAESGQIDAEALARASSGLSHADITNIVNRATVLAAESGSASVTQAHLHRALETHQLGGEVSSLKAAFTETHRERIAVHEAGHALVAHALKAGRVERISIEPRGQALGVTFVSREDEVPLYGERELKARLSMLLAGREAELMNYGNTTSGAADDLKRASELAIEMVSSMGFSSQFGLLSLAGVPDALVGPHIQERALGEARAMLEAAQRACRETLERHCHVLHAVTAALLKDDTVSGALLREMLPAHDFHADAANDAAALRVAMETVPGPV
ncbi:cell division protein ftsH homolog [Aromatoleum aromaticum EbN1]|uniref:Cell division protein ftsH homolog n=1 Tax=Aromatoleum aromaticum (strain DSM 19018 / LMG 30748 / EbN1) TaxID=76114 RepID=Q5P0U1_AROAE|nr:AAA family ATPase [Aromatoleum aromaticum]CAI09073.1 cell division protein ftsH homolog [Aromatoleum aromaticum EbN1]